MNAIGELCLPIYNVLEWKKAETFSTWIGFIWSHHWVDQPSW